MILRCIWCIKDTTTNPCEHCGSDQVQDRTVPHLAHWSRATIATIECKVCDRRVTVEQYAVISDHKCNPQQSIGTTYENQNESNKAGA